MEILELFQIPLSEIPIKTGNLDKQTPFVHLVDEIIRLKKEDKDTTELEDKVDRLVYKLYDLTEEEIAIIEGNIHGK
jgi:hypothetical protein